MSEKEIYAIHECSEINGYGTISTLMGVTFVENVCPRFVWKEAGAFTLTIQCDLRTWPEGNDKDAMHRIRHRLCSISKVCFTYAS